MKHPVKIVVGSRGSLLATTQTHWVIKKIQDQYPECEIEFQIIKTLGDLDQKTVLTDFKNWGIFVKELQNALLDKRIDLVVHSLKDVPEQNPQDLVLTAFPEREEPHDLLITLGQSLKELPENATVGTSSPRRIMQIKKMRPDLQFKVLRGNLPTRVEKLKTSHFDAILLAVAGVNRLNLEVPFAEYLTLDQMVPAIGQGALALECRKNDTVLREALQLLNHKPTEECIKAERQFMKALGGGCQIPMAAFVEVLKDNIYKMRFSLGLRSELESDDVKDDFIVHYFEKTDENLDFLVKQMIERAFEFKKMNL